MSYLFICSGTPQHTSHSASKEQYDPSCPECGAPTKLVEESPARTLKEKARQLKVEGVPNSELAEAMNLEVGEESIRIMLGQAPVITEEQIVWFPGMYQGRQGVYAEPVDDWPGKAVVQLVQERIQEDGKWAIKNGLVGDNEDGMRKMMEWASREENILQSLGHIYRESMQRERTVDWVCRDLANASKWIAGGNARD